MDFFQTLVLGIVQGISEFLPISSSGHLNIIQHFFGFTPSLSFDIFLNTATLASVIFYFRHQLKFFSRHLLYIIIASLPAALVGLFFKSSIESLFTDLTLLPIFYLLTTLFLFLSRYCRSTSSSTINIPKALIIGLFQALAIFPGVSRSASTIFAALLLGLSPLNAFNFSFSLFIPASLGAIILDFQPHIWQSFFNPAYFFIFIVTFLVGLAALSFLRRSLIGSRLWLFSFYTFFLGLSLLLL